MGKLNAPTKRLSLTLPEDLLGALEEMAAAHLPPELAADHRRELPDMVRICLKWAVWKYRQGDDPEDELLSANRRGPLDLEKDPQFRKFMDDLNKGFAS